MVTRDFSGYDVVKVLVNRENFQWVRTAGDQAILEWVHPDGPEVERRTMSVPLYDRVRTGTLRGIADDAGANDFDEFCKWIARNC